MGMKQPPSKNNTLIFLATYNERENVPGLIDRIRASGLAADILFIDDKSPDGTGWLLDRLAERQENLSVIHRPARQGVGSAHQEAIQYASQNGYNLLVTMDADGTHDPEDIPRLIEKSDGAQIVIGSRFLKRAVDQRRGWEIVKSRWTYRATSFLFRFSFDMTNAFRLYRLDKIDPLIFSQCRSSGYAFFPESIYRLYRQGCQIREVPVSLYPRQAGTSKMRCLDVWKWFFTLVYLRIQKDLSLKER